MAVARVKKILIAIHKSEEKKFLDKLQDLGLLHISTSELSQETSIKTNAKEILSEINSAIDYLNIYKKKQGLLAGLSSEKPVLKPNEYESIAQKYNLLVTIEKIKTIQKRYTNLLNIQKTIESEINLLSPWIKLTYKISEIYKSKNTEIVFGFFPTREAYQQTQEVLKELPVQIEKINEQKEITYCIIAFPKDSKEQIKPLLQKFEISDLSKFSGTPREIIENNLAQLKQIKTELDTLIEQSTKLVSELTKLQILSDYYNNLQIQEEIRPGLLKTNEVVFIEGWIKQKDYTKLEKVAHNFTTVVILPTEPRANEQPPVALENKSIFKPFEIILDLYTMPQPVELDPTPLLAPFFAIFFALCLTDAGYGIILLVLSLLLLKKMKTASNFLKLLAICGGFTIVAGAITGGWFGDIVDKLGLQFLVRFRDQLLLFDPIKNPMPFFILSIAIGYLHLNYGFVIEIYDSFRQKNWQAAVFENLPWFLFINGLIVYVFTGKFFPISIRPYIILIILIAIALIIVFTRRNQQLMLNQTTLFIIFLGGLILITAKLKMLVLPTFESSWILGKTILLVALVGLSIISLINQIQEKKFKIISIFFLLGFIASFVGYLVFNTSVYIFLLFSLLFAMLSSSNRKLIKNIIWGLYTLYGGTSFLGVVLSYIRLMALGMVTAGIGMAINTIAWMVIKIPIAGIILAVIILIGGHTYNLLINILGAFVHSLRLNYVEFFPRFFTGGGEKFTPFKRETKYVTIK